MKVLHIYRGYGCNRENSVVDFQLMALRKIYQDIDVFQITSGSVCGYFLAFFQLKRYLIITNPDLIHAHYSYSGYLASLASKKPIVCSLMGSDFLQKNLLERWFVIFFSSFFWRKTIVKNKSIKRKIKYSICIPNGVDFSNFFPINKVLAQEKLGFQKSIRHILFLAKNPYSEVKNLNLAVAAISILKDVNIQFHVISTANFYELPIYYNAADLLLVTSLSEGSPNVIKEAMACNCPIVATDVGDIREVIGDTAGCYVTSFDPKDVAEKIRMALDFGQRTLGREKIGHLDNQLIADRILEVYQEVLAGK
jgi:teichuronic acid biosynthesis glycosyltransferase TuaC